MYADQITKSMKAAIDETNRRRKIQQAYNEEHGITPQTIRKKIYDVPEATKVAEKKAAYGGKLPPEELAELLKSMEQEMRLAAKDMDFERAAEIRDAIIELKGEENKYKHSVQAQGKKRGKRGAQKTSGDDGKPSKTRAASSRK
jgi:excinuclease ABC subunit B